jgi:sugar lactone lactonase YvrE
LHIIDWLVSMLIPISRYTSRLATTLLFAAVLSGCASESIRGQLKVDLRSEKERSDLVWPQPPDKPRYRYAGELVGEQNFVRTEKREVTLASALEWVVGFFEETEPLMLLRPQHGMVSDNGRIYVVDAGRNAIVVFDPNPPADGKSNREGGQLMVWNGQDGKVGFNSPMAVANVWDGDIAVSDAGAGAVLRINRNGEMVSYFGEQHLKRPTGLAFDRKRGWLYVADTVANDIKVYDSSGQLVETVGAPGEDAVSLNAPTYLTFVDDHLYVSDTLNSRIQVFDNDGRHVRSFGERGLNVGNLARPKGVAMDDAGIIYVVESYFGHLLAYNDKYELLLSITGTGEKDDKFALPSGVWTDTKGRIYLADMFNGRIVVYQFLGDKD